MRYFATFYHNSRTKWSHKMYLSQYKYNNQQLKPTSIYSSNTVMLTETDKQDKTPVKI